MQPYIGIEKIDFFFLLKKITIQNYVINEMQNHIPCIIAQRFKLVHVAHSNPIALMVEMSIISVCKSNRLEKTSITNVTTTAW